MELLPPDELRTVLEAQGASGDAPMASLSELAGGSAGEAMRLLNLGGIDTYASLVGLFATLPGLDRPALLKLADGMTGKAAKTRLDLLLDLLNTLLARLARSGVLGTELTEAPPGEAAVFRKLAPTPAAARAWADLQQELSARMRHGIAVNLDPAALILDMGFKVDQTAAKWAA